MKCEIPLGEGNFASRGIRGSILDVARSTKLIAIGAIFGLLALRASIALAQDSNSAKAHELVEAAIQMTDSEKAVKLLWQATDIAPTDEEPYVYLGMYYNSKQDNDDLVKVYQKLVKNEPGAVSAWLNLGEAYMSFTPPKTTDALPCYRKAYELDKTSAMAALRMGEIMAQAGDRDQAIRFLRQAASSPAYAEEARKILTQMGAS
jgi:tetratricopeptide (TPR) repeat protein